VQSCVQPVAQSAPESAPGSSQSDEQAPPARRCLLHAPPRSGRPWALPDEGYRTCSSCLDRLREQLREIGARWAALNPRPGASGDGGRGAPGFGARSPASDAVICVRDWRSSREARTWFGADGRLHQESQRPPLSVPGELWTLAHHVADARGLTGPDHVRVPDLVRWLDGQLDWVTRQDGVAAFGRVLRELVAQLRPLTGEPGPKFIGACPNTIDDGEHTRECGAPLFAPLGGDGRISCRACAREWPREEWLALGRLMQEQGAA
jgi:hypothetical protein